jgi:hypothetical protein
MKKGKPRGCKLPSYLFKNPLDALNYLAAEAKAYQGHRTGDDLQEALAMVREARLLVRGAIVDSAYEQSMREFEGRSSGVQRGKP